MIIPGADSVEKTPSLAYSLVSMWKCSEHRGGSQFTGLPSTSSSGGWIYTYTHKHKSMDIVLATDYFNTYRLPVPTIV